MFVYLDIHMVVFSCSWCSYYFCWQSKQDISSLLLFIITCCRTVYIVVYFKVQRFLRNHGNKFRQPFEEYITMCESTISQRFEIEKKLIRMFFKILIVFIFSYVPGVAFLHVIQYCRHCSCQLRYDFYFILAIY